MITMLSLSRAKQRPHLMGACLMTFLSRVSSNHLDTAMVAIGRRAFKQVKETSPFRQNCFSQYKRDLAVRRQTNVSKLDWRSLTPTSREAVSMVYTTSLEIHPHFLRAACDYGLNYYHYLVSAWLVRKHYIPTRPRAHHVPLLCRICSAVRFATTLYTSRRKDENARSSRTTRNWR